MAGPMLASNDGVVVGVDTHRDIHVAVALSGVGAYLGAISVPTTPGGFADLLHWASALGPVLLFGIEGTGSFGAGLTRWLNSQGHAVLEVDRPDRRARHRGGRSDPLDAETAARAVLSGRATGIPKWAATPPPTYWGGGAKWIPPCGSKETLPTKWSCAQPSRSRCGQDGAATLSERLRRGSCRFVEARRRGLAGRGAGGPNVELLWMRAWDARSVRRQGTVARAPRHAPRPRRPRLQRDRRAARGRLR